MATGCHFIGTQKLVHLKGKGSESASGLLASVVIIGVAWGAFGQAAEGER